MKKSKYNNHKNLWQYVSDSVEPLADRKLSYSQFLDQIPNIDDIWSKTEVKTVYKPNIITRIKDPNIISLPKSVSVPFKILKHGSSAGIAKSQAEKFKKGRLKVEAKLDLHGLTQQSAHSILNNFIQNQWKLGKRCILVVTGKGKGVLQSAVPNWLNQPLINQYILSFNYAQPKDGGSGALYILLKRHKLPNM